MRINGIPKSLSLQNVYTGILNSQNDKLQAN